jgi:hypothetical protein
MVLGGGWNDLAGFGLPFSGIAMQSGSGDAPQAGNAIAPPTLSPGGFWNSLSTGRVTDPSSPNPPMAVGGAWDTLDTSGLGQLFNGIPMPPRSSDAQPQAGNTVADPTLTLGGFWDNLSPGGSTDPSRPPGEGSNSSSDWRSLAGHAAFAGGSFIPGPIGSLAALGDAALSLKEGDPLGAGISGLGAVLGIVSDAGVITSALKAARAGAEAAADSNTFRRAFDPFYQLKAYLKTPGEGNQWHHIVEQSKIDQFGARAIHSVENIVAIPQPIHEAISGHYSSIQPFSDEMRVRDWLRGQSFEKQFQFGLDTMNKYLGR